MNIHTPARKGYTPSFRRPHPGYPDIRTAWQMKGMPGIVKTCSTEDATVGAMGQDVD